MVALRTGLSLGAFSAPLSTRAPTRTPSRFNLFQASRARPRLLPSNSKTVARVFDVLSHSHLHSLFLSMSFLTPTSIPSFFRSSYLAPRALFLKWASLGLPCESWIAVYMGPCLNWSSPLSPSSSLSNLRLRPSFQLDLSFKP